jgi:chorismate mutase
MNEVYVKYKYPYCIRVMLTTNIHLDTATPSNAYME